MNCPKSLLHTTLTLGLALLTLGTSGCKLLRREEARAAIPLEGETRYNGNPNARGSGPSGRPGGYSQGPSSSRSYTNPTITIPRTIPPGSSTRYSSVRTSQPLIAMTFDDGPHPTNTPRLLNMLAQKNIKATFYVVGSRVQSHPQIVARMIREGHEVANHTWTHLYFTKNSDAKIRSELQRTAQAIFKACGQYPRTYRPPYGAITERHRQWVYREFGYPTITWNVDPNDWQKPGPAVVASRLVSGARNGSILLAHDIHSSTVSAMPSTFDRLLAKGFKFVTVTQLINAARVGAAEPEKEVTEKPALLVEAEGEATTEVAAPSTSEPVETEAENPADVAGVETSETAFAPAEKSTPLESGTPQPSTARLTFPGSAP